LGETQREEELLFRIVKLMRKEKKNRARGFRKNPSLAIGKRKKKKENLRDAHFISSKMYPLKI